MPVILRRAKLGRSSCKGIVLFSGPDWRQTLNPDEVEGECFRWGCTATVPNTTHLEVNTPEAIHRVNNKAEFRKLLRDVQLCPPTWFEGEERQSNDFIVRPAHHAQGKKLFRVTNEQEATEAVQACGSGWYATTYINKVKEYRVYVVQGRVVCVAEKTVDNPNQIAWNHAQGGHFRNVQWRNWPLRVIKNAINSFKLSGLDFGGVDVIVDAENRPYTLEINSAPSLTSKYRQECFAGAFKWIVDNGKERIPLREQLGNWKKFIHPAISSEAWT